MDLESPGKIVIVSHESTKIQFGYNETQGPTSHLSLPLYSRFRL